MLIKALKTFFAPSPELDYINANAVKWIANDSTVLHSAPNKAKVQRLLYI